MTKHDVTILGAGPYGLAAGAHLRTIRGLDVQVFGKPMSFWQCDMPRGMLLRSNWTATQIANPSGSLTLEAYMASSGNHFSVPVPLEHFTSYGQWYQSCALPDLDQREIVRVERDADRFRITLSDGETFDSARVVVAAGIKEFARRPPEFAGLPPESATHTSEHRDFGGFAGKRVLIIGSGQSALESAALLHEAQADVEVFGRAHEIHWLQGWASVTLHRRFGSAIRKLLYAPTDVGPAGISQLMARPDLLRKLPRGLQDRLRKRSVRPAGARWLVNRLTHVPIHLGRSVRAVTETAGKVKVRFDNGDERTVDHVILGTGYQIDISKYQFLSSSLKGAIARFNGFPVLQAGLETSVRGLHILGAPAVWSFGPLMQFVSGTGYASRALTRHISESGRVQ